MPALVLITMFFALLGALAAAAALFGADSRPTIDDDRLRTGHPAWRAW